jgi:hypothetical protein
LGVILNFKPLLLCVAFSASVSASVDKDVLYLGGTSFSASVNTSNYNEVLTVHSSSSKGEVFITSGPVIKGNGALRYSMSFQPGFYFSDDDHGVGFSSRSKLYISPMYVLEAEYRATNSLNSSASFVNPEEFIRVGVVVDWFTTTFDSSFGAWREKGSSGLYFGVRI